MKLLYDIKSDLKRIMYAGSRNAANDIRISKHLPALNKLGEKQQVFLTLENHLKNLISDDKNSSDHLVKSIHTLYAILETIKSSSVEITDEFKEVNELHADIKSGSYVKSTTHLSDYKFKYFYGDTAYNNSIEKEFSSVEYDIRFMNKTYGGYGGNIYKCTQNYFQVTKNTIVAKYRLVNLDFQHFGNFKNELKFVGDVLGTEAIDVALKVLDGEDKKLKKFYPEAIEILGYDKQYEERVLSFLPSKNKEIIKSVLVALNRMNSDKYITTLNEHFSFDSIDLIIPSVIDTYNKEACDYIMNYLEQLVPIEDSKNGSMFSKLLGKGSEFDLQKIGERQQHIRNLKLSEKTSSEKIKHEYIFKLLFCLSGKYTEETYNFIEKMFLNVYPNILHYTYLSNIAQVLLVNLMSLDTKYNELLFRLYKEYGLEYTKIDKYNGISIQEYTTYQLNMYTFVVNAIINSNEFSEAKKELHALKEYNPEKFKSQMSTFSHIKMIGYKFTNNYNSEYLFANYFIPKYDMYELLND